MLNRFFLRKHLLIMMGILVILGFSTHVLAGNKPEEVKGTAQVKKEKFDKTGKTDINKATAGELAKVSGITSELAKAIVKYREEYGDFQTGEELLKVKGMTRELFQKVKKYLYLSGVKGDCPC